MSNNKPTYEELENKVEALEVSMARFNRSSIKKNEEDNEITIHDLIDVDDLEELMQLFYQATGLGVGLANKNFEIIAHSGWQKICTHFHQKHPQANKSCVDSRGFFMKNIKQGEATRYKCNNGLWDIAYPIYFEDTFVGAIYFGQFFLKGEEIDKGFFVKQANKFNFDVDSYLALLKNVPILENEKVNTFVKLFAVMLEKLTGVGEYSLIQIE